MAVATRVKRALVRAVIVVFGATVLLALAYWYFFLVIWAPAIPMNVVWQYGFAEKEVGNTTANLEWNTIENGTISKEEYTDILVLRKTFQVADVSKVLQAVLLLDNNYTVRILLNDIEIASVDRFLIGSDTPTKETKTVGFSSIWSKRKCFFSSSDLGQKLKYGENVLKLVFSNKYGRSSVKPEKIEFWLQLEKPSYSAINSPDLKFSHHIFSESDLPILKIDTRGLVIPDEPKVIAVLSIIDNEGTNRLTSPATEQKVRIERRGHTSQKTAKRSYTLALEQKQELLGLPASSKWVLYGPYMDKSLIRNALTYSLYSQMGALAPKYKYLELIVNNNYRGIYMLIEKVQLGMQQLNFKELAMDPKDSSLLSGGYLLEIDRDGWNAPFPLSTDNSHESLIYKLNDPKWALNNKTAIARIQQQFYEMEKHLYENDTPLERIDMSSFIDYMIITEFSKNIDGYRLSLFLYNPDISQPVPKFHIGPIWDYNFSFGLSEYKSGYDPEGFMYELDNTIPFWWTTLFSDSTFHGQFIQRYGLLRKSVLSQQNVNATIDSLVTEIQSSVQNNFKKWEGLGSSDFWPNYFLGKDYPEEVDYLKEWGRKRGEFLDSELLHNTSEDHSNLPVQ